MLGGTYAWRGPAGEQVLSLKTRAWIRPSPIQGWTLLLHPSVRELTNNLVAYLTMQSSNSWYDITNTGDWLDNWITNCDTSTRISPARTEAVQECIVLGATNQFSQVVFEVPCLPTSNSVLAAVGASGVFHYVDPRRWTRVLTDWGVVSLRVPLRSPP